MAQALYRKYRSRSFDEVIGQDHITHTLQAALKNGQLSHAYLFTGPRGVGKTSVARILAYAVNGIEYSSGGSHLDIIEIDGASNRRIEEVRDLRDKARILPSSGKYKVYIIDEVHMLTREAFNALLKTLEEPPEHCIFILATTEAHKLPATIVSRTQRFSFKPIDVETLAKHLADIAKKENIKADQGALRLIAEHGEGSFRDSIGLLDQLGSADSPVDEQVVRDLLGVAPSEMISQLTLAVSGGDSKSIIASLEKAKDLGISPASLAKSIAAQLRALLVNGQSFPTGVALLTELLEIPASYSPYARLEVALLAAASLSEAGNSPIKSTPPEEKEQQPQAKKTKETKKSPPLVTKKSGKDLRQLDWAKLQSEVKKKDSAIGLALKHSVAKLNGRTLQLIFEYSLYKNKVASAQGTKVVAQTAQDLISPDIKIEFLVDKEQFLQTTKLPGGKEQSIEDISNIFGGGEVIESSVS